MSPRTKLTCGGPTIARCRGRTRPASVARLPSGAAARRVSDAVELEHHAIPGFGPPLPPTAPRTRRMASFAATSPARLRRSGVVGGEELLELRHEGRRASPWTARSRRGRLRHVQPDRAVVVRVAGPQETVGAIEQRDRVGCVAGNVKYLEHPYRRDRSCRGRPPSASAPTAGFERTPYRRLSARRGRSWWGLPLRPAPRGGSRECSPACRECPAPGSDRTPRCHPRDRSGYASSAPRRAAW